MGDCPSSPYKHLETTMVLLFLLKLVFVLALGNGERKREREKGTNLEESTFFFHQSETDVCGGEGERRQKEETRSKIRRIIAVLPDVCREDDLRKLKLFPINHCHMPAEKRILQDTSYSPF